MKEFREKLRAARRVKDPFIRAERVQALGEYDDPGVVDALIPFLDPGEPPLVRTAAAAALGQVGGARTVEPLIRCLADPWYDVRCQAARALGQIGDRRATEPLNRCLLEEKDGYAIAAFVEALGPLGDASSVEPLLASVSRYPGRVEAALVQIGQPVVEALIRTLEGQESVARQVSVTALGQIGDTRAIEPLRKLLSRSRNITLLTAVAQALHRLGWKSARPAGRSHQLVLIATGEWDALVRIGKPALRLLTHALRHQERGVRCGAANALAEIGDPDAVPALVSCFQAWRQKDGWTRQAAARALGRLGDRQTVEPLLAYVEHREAGLHDRPRQVEIEALAQIGDPRAVGPLIEIALSDRPAQRRSEAIHGLGAWQDPRIVEALRGLLSDPDLDIRQSAAEGLGQQNWEPATPEETAALLVAARRWAALVEQGRHWVPTLIRALGDEPQSVQERIACALGQIGDLEAAKTVVAWLFAHPALILDEAACKGWIGDLQPLLDDYAAPIVHAACYAKKDTHVLRDDASITEHEYTYDLSAGNRAIHRLSGLDTAIAANVLYQVAEKEDATVDVDFSENEWGSGFGRGSLGFAEQREMARQALRRRPDACYDPSAFQIRANWVLPVEAKVDPL